MIIAIEPGRDHAVITGDSWQLLLNQPGDALRAGLFVWASLMACELDIDTRLAIGVGGVDCLPESGVEQADGEAFRSSGRLLSNGLRR